MHYHHCFFSPIFIPLVSLYIDIYRLLGKDTKLPVLSANAAERWPSRMSPGRTRWLTTRFPSLVLGDQQMVHFFVSSRNPYRQSIFLLPPNSAWEVSEDRVGKHWFRGMDSRMIKEILQINRGT